METDLQMLEEGSQVNMHLDGLKATLKNITNWKTSGLEGIHKFWFKKYSPPYTTDLEPK